MACATPRLPVLAEWHSCKSPKRPARCGVVDCTASMVPGKPCHPCDCSGAGCKAGRCRLVVKEYHLKHRLCPAHCKCPAVLRQGAPQRWCAQCNAFHELDAFDGDRGSCAAKLKVHNERRMRPGSTATFKPAPSKRKRATAELCCKSESSAPETPSVRSRRTKRARRADPTLTLPTATPPPAAVASTVAQPLFGPGLSWSAPAPAPKIVCAAACVWGAPASPTAITVPAAASISATSARRSSPSGSHAYGSGGAARGGSPDSDCDEADWVPVLAEQAAAPGDVLGDVLGTTLALTLDEGFDSVELDLLQLAAGAEAAVAACELLVAAW